MSALSTEKFIAAESPGFAHSDQMGGETFEGWIAGLIAAQFDGKAVRLAEAIGLTASAFSRSVRTGTLGVPSLLRLALVAGDTADSVLRRAGKADVADLLVKLYAGAEDLSPDERHVLTVFRSFPDVNARKWWVRMGETHPSRSDAGQTLARGRTGRTT